MCQYYPLEFTTKNGDIIIIACGGDPLSTVVSDKKATKNLSRQLEQS